MPTYPADQRFTQQSTTVFHPISTADRTAMAGLRAIVEPHKGSLRGTEARAPFDAIMAVKRLSPGKVALNAGQRPPTSCIASPVAENLGSMARAASNSRRDPGGTHHVAVRRTTASARNAFIADGVTRRAARLRASSQVTDRLLSGEAQICRETQESYLLSY